jgi:hypothetical protein
MRLTAVIAGRHCSWSKPIGTQAQIVKYLDATPLSFSVSI